MAGYLVQINVETRKLSLPKSLIPVALSDRRVFKNKFQEAIDVKRINYISSEEFQVSEDTLRRMIKKYSEQAVYRPLDDIRYYFQYESRAFIEPGYPPLFYPVIQSGKSNQKINISAISAIGEGVTGFLCQRIYGCRKLTRPIQDGVDIIMTDNEKTYLVEAKGSTASDIFSFVQKLDDDYLTTIVRETLSASGIDQRPVIGILMGVHLKDESNYSCYITEIEIQVNQ
ncbi:MAG: hypothetical protein WBB28_12375 [Crinalium sp.]